MNLLIESNFKEKGDVELIMKYIREPDGVLRTQYLEIVHADLAVRAVFELLLRDGWVMVV